MFKSINKNQNSILLLLIILIGLYLRLNNIKMGSLWYDELFSIDFSNPKRNFLEMIKLTIEDVHPPFYQIILWLWFKIVGFSEINAKLLSIIIGLISIFVSYLFSKEFFNKKTSLAISFIFSLSFFLIWYSQEVRSYQLTVLLSILSYLYLFNTLMKKDKKNIYKYWIVTIIWMYTHYFSFFIIFSQFIFTLIYIHFFSDHKYKLYKLLILTMIVFFIALLPLLPYILDISSSDKFYFLKKPEFFYFLNFIHTYFGYGGIFFVLFSFLLNLYFLLTTQISRKDKVFLLLLSTWMLLGFIFLYLKSIYSFSLIQIRYTIVMVPPIIFLSAFGISKLKTYLQITFLLFFIIFSYKVLFLDTHSTYKQDYKKVLNYVSKYNTIPIYELVPGNGHNGNNTNHFQVYSDILNLKLKIIDDTVFQKKYNEKSLQNCYWVIYTFDNIVINSLNDLFKYYKINQLNVLYKKKYYKAEAALISMNNKQCNILDNIKKENIK